MSNVFSALLTEALQRRQLRPVHLRYSSTGPPHAPTHHCLGTYHDMFGKSYILQATSATKRGAKNEVCRQMLSSLPPCINSDSMPFAVLTMPIHTVPYAQKSNHAVAIDAEWSSDGCLLSMQTATLRDDLSLDVTVLENALDAARQMESLGTDRRFVFLDGRLDRRFLLEQWNISFPMFTDVEDHVGRYMLSARPGLKFLAMMLLGVNIDKGPRSTFTVQGQGLTPTQVQYAALDAVVTLLIYIVARLSHSVDDVSKSGIHSEAARILSQRFLQVL
jgi:hypothetical protein